MADNSSLHQTMKISISELKELQEQLEEEGGPEITIRVTPEILGRVDALVEMMSDDGDINFQAALRQVFMAGLYTLESEFKDS